MITWSERVEDRHACGVCLVHGGAVMLALILPADPERH